MSQWLFFFSLNLKVSLLNRSPVGTWSQKEQIENDELLTLEIAPLTLDLQRSKPWVLVSSPIISGSPEQNGSDRQ